MENYPQIYDFDNLFESDFIWITLGNFKYDVC